MREIVAHLPVMQREGAGIAIGLTLGICFGVAFNNITLGIVLGLCFGVIFEVQKKGNDKDDDQ